MKKLLLTISVIVLGGLVVLFPAASRAQQVFEPIEYMKIGPVTPFLAGTEIYTNYNRNFSANAGIRCVQLGGGFGGVCPILELPQYGRVLVILPVLPFISSSPSCANDPFSTSTSNCTLPPRIPYVSQYSTLAEGKRVKSIFGFTYAWNNDTSYIGVTNTYHNPDQFIDYTINFVFLDGQPDPNSLFLVIAFLGNPTTGRGISTATMSQPGYLVGEAQLGPYNSQFPSECNAVGSPSTVDCWSWPTTINKPYPTQGTILGQASLCQPPPPVPPATVSNCDSNNTGWALFQLASILKLVQGVPTLSVTFHQQLGDGIGFTLGYTRGIITGND
jgi:hypothetical protein